MITHTQGGRTFAHSDTPLRTQKKWANISIPEVRWTCSWHFAPAASTPPSSSPQPWHLITADSQLTHARITNLFHFSSIPLMTPVRSATYLYPCYPQTQVSLFLCLEPKLMWQHSWGRKMNIVVALFIVLKGTATYSGLLWRLYLEVNYSPMRTYCRAIWSFFMPLIFYVDGVTVYVLSPASCVPTAPHKRLAQQAMHCTINGATQESASEISERRERSFCHYVTSLQTSFSDTTFQGLCDMTD